MIKATYFTAGASFGTLLSAVAFPLVFVKMRSQDPAKLAPDNYKVILDNSKLRVIEYHLAPGEKEPVHSHPQGAFVYFLTDADTRAAASPAQGVTDHKKMGDYVWRNPVTHAGENVGSKDSRSPCRTEKLTTNSLRKLGAQAGRE